MFESTQTKNNLGDKQEYIKRRSEKDYDPCQVLGMGRAEFFGLPEEEQAKVAKQKFREKARQVHPDKTTDPAEKSRLTAEFQEANQAYAFLTNPEIKGAEKKYFDSQQAWQKQQEEKRQRDAQERAHKKDSTVPPPEPPLHRKNQTVQDMMDEALAKNAHAPIVDRNAQRLQQEQIARDFHLPKESKYWNTFIKMYQQRNQIKDQFGRESFRDAKAGDPTIEARKQIAVELRQLTHELFQEQKMPAPMFNMYLRAFAELAKAATQNDVPLTLEDLHSSLEYQIVESYHRLATGALAVGELLDSHTLTLFNQHTGESGQVSYSLKEDITDADMRKLDQELRTKIEERLTKVEEENPPKEQSLPNSVETAQKIRPREEIHRDLEELEAQSEKLDRSKKEMNEEYEKLGESDQEILERLSERLETEEISEEVLKTDYPQHLIPLALQMKSYIEGMKAIPQQQEALQVEEVPYLHVDYEHKLQSLSGKINYDGILTYYQDLKIGRREVIGENDSLHNTTTEFYTLRKYQQRVKEADPSLSDYSYLSNGLLTMNQFEEKWEQKGFLKNTSVESSQIPELPVQQITEARKELVDRANKAIEILREYGSLCQTYRESLFDNRDYDDDWLKELVTALSFKPGEIRNSYYSEDFDQIDIGPDFIAAANRHIDKIIAAHQRAGRLPKSEEILREERRRIDAIPAQELFTKITLIGFDAPEGSVAIITPEQIKVLLKKMLPPDFAQDLRSISRKSVIERRSNDDVNIEVIGRFFPIVDTKTWDQIIATEIEIYREESSVPIDTPQETVDSLHFQMIKIMLHEFGHNAHYKMDYEEMMAWEKVIATDKTAVTAYVKRSKQEDEDKGKREDLAESFQLFLTQPAVLYVISRSRYEFMRDYFHRHLQSQQVRAFDEEINTDMANTFAIWYELGRTDAKIRERYLAHEYEEE